MGDGPAFGSASAEMSTEGVERHQRRVTLPSIGPRGQEKLAASTVVVVGCSGLGTVAAELLTRVGVGRLRLVDGDRVKAADLVTHTLFGEEEAESKHFKALAAAERLRTVNSAICVEYVANRITSVNGDRLLEGADLILDGSGNDATRHVINQICVGQAIPWVFAAVSESSGLMMNIVPGETPCFACIFGDPDSPALDQGCVEERGLLPPVTTVVASLQVSQGIRLLLGDEGYSRDLLYVDAWKPLLKTVSLVKRPRGVGACRICGWY